MAGYKYPRIVEFVDALPMTATGKILKRELVLMRAARSIALGALMVLVGALWTFQGLGYLEGSSMTGQTIWAIIGPILAGLGVGLMSSVSAPPLTSPGPAWAAPGLSRRVSARPAAGGYPHVTTSRGSPMYTVARTALRSSPAPA